MTMMLEWNEYQKQLAAAKQGAPREEIMETLGVAITVNAGAALVYSARAMGAFSAKTARP